MICICLYLTIGLIGVASLKSVGTSDLLATFAASENHKILITVINILFPVSVLITSVPVFAIVIRYNSVRGGFCSRSKLTLERSLVGAIIDTKSRMGHCVGKRDAMDNYYPISDKSMLAQNLPN